VLGAAGFEAIEQKDVSVRVGSRPMLKLEVGGVEVVRVTGASRRRHLVPTIGDLRHRTT
jgi:hypothetical protein